jgi:hypothetical protein
LRFVQKSHFMNPSPFSVVMTTNHYYSLFCAHKMEQPLGPTIQYIQSHLNQPALLWQNASYEVWMLVRITAATLPNAAAAGLTGKIVVDYVGGEILNADDPALKNSTRTYDATRDGLIFLDGSPKVGLRMPSDKANFAVTHRKFSEQDLKDLRTFIESGITTDINLQIMSTIEKSTLQVMFEGTNLSHLHVYYSTSTPKEYPNADLSELWRILERNEIPQITGFFTHLHALTIKQIGKVLESNGNITELGLRIHVKVSNEEIGSLLDQVQKSSVNELSVAFFHDFKVDIEPSEKNFASHAEKLEVLFHWNDSISEPVKTDLARINKRNFDARKVTGLLSIERKYEQKCPKTVLAMISSFYPKEYHRSWNFKVM